MEFRGRRETRENILIMMKLVIVGFERLRQVEMRLMGRSLGMS